MTGRKPPAKKRAPKKKAPAKRPPAKKSPAKKRAPRKKQPPPKPEPLTLEEAVNKLTEDDIVGTGQASVLAALARTLVDSINAEHGGDDQFAPPVAALSKELRSTIERLTDISDHAAAAGDIAGVAAAMGTVNK